jgi:hypothetical protein
VDGRCFWKEREGQESSYSRLAKRKGKRDIDLKKRQEIRMFGFTFASLLKTDLKMILEWI